jgi:hypothetical protein
MYERRVCVALLFMFWMSGCGGGGSGSDQNQVIGDAATNNDHPNVKVRFQNFSSALPERESYGDYGALWGDFNNDQKPDLVFPGHGSGVLILAQQENNVFEDVTSASGIKDSNWEYSQQSDRHGASCADFNNDGNLDLYISHGAKRGETLGIKFDELLRGNGDFTFTDVVKSAGTLNEQGRGRGGIWTDYNNDGWLDLYATNFVSNNAMYRNNGDGTFSDVTAETGLGFSAPRVVPVDFDQDGHIDLVIAWPLKLLRNDGTGVFEEVSKQEFPQTGIFAYGLAVGDADNDGDPDILVSGLGERNVLLINDNGKFHKVESDAWLSDDDITTGSAWGNIDNDGLLDLVQVRSDGYYIFRNLGDLSFLAERIDAPAPNIEVEGNGDAALADFNDDGLLDIAADDTNGYLLLKNESTTSNSWLQLQFDGRKNNRLGFGNKVWITAKDKLLAYREYTGSAGGFRSFGCNPLHIGLGAHSVVDVRVRWLNGHETILENVTANQLLSISD